MKAIAYKITLLAALTGLGGLAACSRDNYAQGGETDDLYFSSKDRKTARYASVTEPAAAQTSAATRRRSTNPDYLAQYDQQVREQYTATADEQDPAAQGDTYYDPEYRNDEVLADNVTLARRRPSYGYNSVYPSYNVQNYYGNSWHDPYWANSWNNGNAWGPAWGGGWGYDPFFRSSWWGPSVRVSVGWGGGWGWNRWNNWGWCDPFWGSGYSAWGHDPFFYGGGWGRGWNSGWGWGGGWNNGWGGGWNRGWGNNVWVNNNYYYGGRNSGWNQPRQQVVVGGTQGTGGSPRAGNDNSTYRNYGSRGSRGSNVVNEDFDNSPGASPRSGRMSSENGTPVTGQSGSSRPARAGMNDMNGRTSDPNNGFGSQNSDFSNPSRPVRIDRGRGSDGIVTPRGNQEYNEPLRSGRSDNNVQNGTSNPFESRPARPRGNSGFENSNSGNYNYRRNDEGRFSGRSRSDNGGSQPTYSQPSTPTYQSRPSRRSDNDGGGSWGGSRPAERSAPARSSNDGGSSWGGGNSNSGRSGGGGSGGGNSNGSGTRVPR